MGLNPYRVNIVGLSNRSHTFEYDLKDEFFVQYGQELISGGSFKASIVLDKHETFIDAEFSIKGQARLVCDRSLEPFDFPISIRKKVVFKYGDEEKELSDDILIITRETDSLDLGQLMYEFISLEIPMRKIHPRFQSEEEKDGEGKIIYTSSTGKTDDDDDIDPRWEQLKKLK